MTEKQTKTLKLLNKVLPGGKRLTHAEIAREVGISRERVRQLAARWGYTAASVIETNKTITQQQKQQKRKEIQAKRLAPLLQTLAKEGLKVELGPPRRINEITVEGKECLVRYCSAARSTTDTSKASYYSFQISDIKPFNLFLVPDPFRLWIIPDELLQNTDKVYISKDGAQGYNNRWPKTDWNQYENAFFLLSA